jgi:MtN3 and saliva related transmembrane protein
MKDAVAIVFGFGMLINAALFVPQAWHLWKTKRADGISVLSFAGFNTLQLIGVIHGWFQRDYALMTGMFVSLLTCGSVTALAACYSRARRAHGTATTPR